MGTEGTAFLLARQYADATGAQLSIGGRLFEEYNEELREENWRSYLYRGCIIVVLSHFVLHFQFVLHIVTFDIASMTVKRSSANYIFQIKEVAILPNFTRRR